MGCDINRAGDEHVDGVRSDLHEARNDGSRMLDGGTDQFETGLTRLLTRTCGDDDHVGVAADFRPIAPQGMDTVGKKLEPCCMS